jgi:predicted SprT family Zn-dependent metalloprotease
MAGLIETKKKALTLMKKHKLIKNGWWFKWDHAKTRIGCCHYDDKMISLSKYWTKELTLNEMEKTILHEIAHAIVGHKVKSHGSEWRDKCIEIGGDGERCGKVPKMKDIKTIQLHYNYKPEQKYRMRN